MVELFFRTPPRGGPENTKLGPRISIKFDQIPNPDFVDFVIFLESQKIKFIDFYEKFEISIYDDFFDFFIEISIPNRTNFWSISDQLSDPELKQSKNKILDKFMQLEIEIFHFLLQLESKLFNLWSFFLNFVTNFLFHDQLFIYSNFRDR